MLESRPQGGTDHQADLHAQGSGDQRGPLLSKADYVMVAEAQGATTYSSIFTVLVHFWEIE